MKYSEIINEFRDICLRHTTRIARKVDVETSTIRNLRSGAVPSPLHLEKFIKAGLLKVPLEKLDDIVVRAAYVEAHPKEIKKKTGMSICQCYGLANGDLFITSKIILRLESAELI